jgi:SAM-dependent methyltransferase
MANASRPREYSFTRYLAAKKELDDRSLNRHVWETLRREVAAFAVPLQVLEVGCGIGTMLERLWDWGLLRGGAYTGIDLEAQHIAVARDRWACFAAARGIQVREEEDGSLVSLGGGSTLRVELTAGDLFDFVHREQGRRRWNLLIAHALLDLLDLSRTLAALFAVLAPGGLFYFTLNFDGVTCWLPEINAVLDRHIEALYHQTMDRRGAGGQSAGRSRTGRRLLPLLRELGAQVLAAGGSDWVVCPGPDGYPGDEAYFLHFLIHTVHTTLQGRPQPEAAVLDSWADRRHAQIEQGELIYLAHQLDVVGRIPEF